MNPISPTNVEAPTQIAAILPSNVIIPGLKIFYNHFPCRGTYDFFIRDCDGLF
jgi:hypothetical protein